MQSHSDEMSITQCLSLSGFLLLNATSNSDHSDTSNPSIFLPFNGNSIAVVGKNGSGKSHLLKKMVKSAVALNPDEAFEPDAHWSAGFVLGRNLVEVEPNAISSSGGETAASLHISLMEVLGTNFDDDTTLSWTDLLPIGSALRPGTLLVERGWQQECEAQSGQADARVDLISLIPHQVLRQRTGFHDSLTTDGWLVVPLHLRDPNAGRDEIVGNSSLRRAIVNALSTGSGQRDVSGDIREKYEIPPGLISPFQLPIDAIWSIYESFDNFAFESQVAKSECLVGNPRLFWERWEGWRVAPVRGTRTYRCPNCDGTTDQDHDHVVVWPGDEIDARRHWHKTCFLKFTGVAPFSLAVDPVLVDLQNLEIQSCLPKSIFGLQADLDQRLSDDVLQLAHSILVDWQVIPGLLGDMSMNSEVQPQVPEISIYGLRNDLGEWDHSGTYIGKVKVNETTNRWIMRSIQVALLLMHGSAAKIVLWDEPESGLHWQLLRQISNRVLPSLELLGIKVIFTTHSLELARSSDSVIVSADATDGGYRLAHDIDSEHLLSIGFRRQDLLLDIETFVLVEGKHDRIVLETIFADKLRHHKCKLIPFEGTPNLRSVASDYLLIDNHEAKLFVIIDGGSRSLISRPDIKALNTLMSDGQPRLVKKDLQRLLGNFTRADEWRESYKLLKFIERIVNFEPVKAREVLKRVEVFMLQEDDVTHYLNPAVLFNDLVEDQNWTRLKAEYETYRSETLAQGKQPLSMKPYYRECSDPSLRVSTSQLIEAARHVRESGITNGDLRNLEKWLFR